MNCAVSIRPRMVQGRRGPASSVPPWCAPWGDRAGRGRDRLVSCAASGTGAGGGVVRHRVLLRSSWSGPGLGWPVDSSLRSEWHPSRWVNRRDRAAGRPEPAPRAPRWRCLRPVSPRLTGWRLLVPSRRFRRRDPGAAVHSVNDADCPTIAERPTLHRGQLPCTPPTDPTAYRPPPGDAASHALDALVVGAGQAGLASATTWPAGPAVPPGRRRLRDRALLGNRWDSLRLFTPAEYYSLPGMAFPAAPGTYPVRTRSPTT